MSFLDWFKKPKAPPNTPRPALESAASYRVAVDDESVSCTTPGGETSTVAFAELERVVIRTTDEGPISPDVFWVLTGAGRTCVVPQGATGEQTLMDRLGKLPGFNFEAMIAAMICAENREFDCWKRPLKPANSLTAMPNEGAAPRGRIPSVSAAERARPALPEGQHSADQSET